ncbi:MAG: Ig-like domain-containing protein [Actinomycetes bacterium]
MARSGSNRNGAFVAVVGAAGVALVLSGCGAASSAFGGPKDSVAVITVTPDQSTSAAANAPIVVSVSNGKLTDVAVTGPKGQVLGTTDTSGSKWTSNTNGLAFGATYQVTAKAVDDAGMTADVSKTLTTVKPTKSVSAQFDYFEPGATVGTGMTVRLVFDRPVKNTAEVEKALVVTSSKPIVGAWGWDKNKTAVDFRPQTYWPASDVVTVSANLHGVEVAKGVYGDKNLKTNFKTGSATVITIDARKHNMKFVRNGKLVKTFPVTTGKSGFETRSGVKPIMAKEGTVVMDAASGGTSQSSAEYYRVTADYSMRMTPSGEFIHSAPWSMGSQGYDNVSHGCVGMSPSNAAWVYSNVRVGDVVIVKNTGRPQDLGNGITDWNITWPKWLARSATGAQNIGPNGPSASGTNG